MAYHLVVREPFGDYLKGQRITDPSVIKTVEDADKHAHVVRVAAVTEPEPPKKTPDPS